MGAGSALLVIEYAASGAGRFAHEAGAAPPLPPSIVREGWAMAACLALDAAAVGEAFLAVDAQLLETPPARRLAAAGVRLLPLDSAAQERALYASSARWDAAILVAPETDGLLLERSRWLDDAGADRLGPSLDALRLAADKHACARRLRAAGVPAPRGFSWDAGDPWPDDLRCEDGSPLAYPVVVKPRDGCGSQDVAIIPSAAAAREIRRPFAARAEAFHPGLAASVACLTGPRGLVPLPACRQTLSEDGRFAYLGGETPLPSPLAARAAVLAARAVAALPACRGWIGVDLVLGEDPAGREDVVIEVNPRLTTSYVGLRRFLSPTNLVSALRAVARGEPTPPFKPGGEAVRWQVGSAEWEI